MKDSTQIYFINQSFIFGLNSGCASMLKSKFHSFNFNPGQ